MPATLGQAESTARALKAASLADVLAAQGATADDLAHLSDLGWRLAALAAAEHRGRPMGMPSAATRDLVAALLRDREAVAAREAYDEWAGLPGVDE